MRAVEAAGPVEPEPEPGGARPDGTWRRLGKLLPVIVGLPALLVVGLVSGSPSTDPSCAAQPTAIFDGDLQRILATIRTLESGGDYAAQAAGSTASGAYQFIDSSWANYGGYSRAWLAPPHVQDAKAAEHVTAILQRHHGDVSTVPVDLVPRAPPGGGLGRVGHRAGAVGGQRAHATPVPGEVAGRLPHPDRARAPTGPCRRRRVAAGRPAPG